MSQHDAPEIVELALSRSALYEALALGFLSPSAETIMRLVDPDQNTALAEMAAVCEAALPRGGHADLVTCVRRLRETAAAGGRAILRVQYAALFGHTAQGPVPLYETEYGKESLFQQPQQLGDISGFYQAFGLVLNPAAHERVDHISCECEYLAFLARKEAHAIIHDLQDNLAATRRAQRLFLRDHLGRFAPACARLLVQKDGGGFYAALGQLGTAFISRECTLHQVPAGPEHLRMRAVSLADDSCFTCGSGEQLVQISTAGLGEAGE